MSEPQEIKLALVNHDGSPSLDENNNQRWRTITPLWTINGNIPAQYHSVAIAMADSHTYRNSWHNEKTSRFMWTRDRFIAVCEQAKAIEWHAIQSDFDSKKALQKQVSDFTNAVRAFRKALASAPPQMGAPQKLTHFFQRMLEHYSDPDAQQWQADLDDKFISGLTSRNPLAVLDALAQNYEKEPWTNLGKGAFQHGLIGYKKLPARLVDKRVVLSLVLADIYTCTRADEFQDNKVDLPKTPNFSRDTPWDVIRLFVDSVFVDANTALGTCSKSRNLQKRVIAAKKSGALIGFQAG